MLHHVEQSKTIERGSVDFVARLQVHDQFFAIELSGDGTIGAVRRGTVSERPGMDLRAALELFRCGFACRWIGGSEFTCARAPLLIRVFNVGIENLAPAIDSQRDGVGRAPFVQRRRVKEPDQCVALAPLAHELAGGGEDVVQRAR